MSNICPQNQELNGGIWNDLQELVAGQRPDAASWSRRFGWLLVVTGPIYDDVRELLSDSARIEIPDGFYKIVLRIEEDRPIVLAFRFPHEEAERRSLEAYLVSVDEIERLTGLDFFSALADEIEGPLESVPASALWPK